MTRRALIAAISTAASLRAQKNSGQQKGPEVELLEAAAHVEEQRVNIDGRVKNVAGKPIRKLTVIYEILDPSNHVLTKQQGPVEEPVLEAGEEGTFHAQMAYHARTHAFRLSFEDGSGRELRSEKTGPFPVE